MTTDRKPKIVVLGGGAAGFFASIHAAGNGSEVILLEKSGQVLSKVRVSGGGRCNVTNALTDPALVAACYPRGSKELLGPLTRFGPLHTQEWFLSRGVPLKTEPDGRIFPVTDSSQTIIDCLLTAASQTGVKLNLHTAVTSIKPNTNDFELVTASGTSLRAGKVIVATGGNPALKSYTWLQDLGHTIQPPVPSLFTFNIPQSPFLDLMGVSVQDCIVKIAGTRMQQRGPLLFTHWGISGPSVLRLSAWAARNLNELKYNFRVILNFLPDFTDEQVMDLFNLKQNENSGIFNSPFRQIPSRLWQQLCLLAGAGENQRWRDSGKKTQNKLLQLLRACVLEVSGKTTFKEEFVTCGGVTLKEVDMKTMESKIIPGLYFAGEVLDLDGITGGFNFQAAWTTGYIAGTLASGEKIH